MAYLYMIKTSGCWNFFFKVTLVTLKDIGKAESYKLVK